MTLAAASAPSPGPRRVSRLDAAIQRHVAPGMHLHFASTPSRSNAAIRELARAFVGTRPAFHLSATGFHSMAHLLPALGLAERLTGCFFGDHYPAPRPHALYSRLLAEGVQIDHWSLWSLVSAFRAGAQGDAWAIDRSLRGTTIAAELAARGAYRELEVPGEPARPLGLIAALRPDLTFVHAPCADEDGHVVMPPPLSEGVSSALAARAGVIATVERIVPAAFTRAHAAMIAIPPHRVLAVCEEPYGAHPQPCRVPAGLEIAGYPDDFAHYEQWRALVNDPAALAQFVTDVLRAPDGGAAYRRFVGEPRLAELARAGSPRNARSRRTSRPRATDLAGDPASPASAAASDTAAGDLASPSPTSAEATRLGSSHRAKRADPEATAASDSLIIAGARQLVARVRATQARVLIAGIGHAFFAARIAQLQLAAAGVPLRVMVETGLYDLDCGPAGHGYLLAADNMARARRLTAIDDVLGILVGGADNRCVGALGAAQVDRDGNLNSTRLGGKLLVGSGGACDIAAAADDVVVMTRLAPGRLVERVPYLTSPGRVVRSVVTDRGTLSRTQPGDPWTVTCLAPTRADRARHASDERDAQLAALTQDCPWRPKVAPGLEPAPPFTAEETDLLEQLDPQGTFRERAG